LPLKKSRCVLEHWPFICFFLMGATLRVVVWIAYYPGFIFVGDSMSYLRSARDQVSASSWRPQLYPMFMKPFLIFDNLAVVTAMQHLIGLGTAGILYLILRRLRTPTWLAALGCAPVMLDAYQLNIEQQILAEPLFGLLIVGAIGLLVWKESPGTAAAGTAGVLIAGAVLARYVGLAALPSVLLFMLVRRTHWTRVVAFSVGLAVPLAGYALWFKGQTGNFNLSSNSGYVLYGKVAAFAECDGMELPRYERQLCVRLPREERVDNYAMWNPQSPLRALIKSEPGVDMRPIVNSFNRRFIRRQLPDYGAAVADDFLDFFKPRSWEGRQTHLRWRFPVEFEDARGLPPQIRANEGSAPPQLELDQEFKINRPLASFLHDYQSFVYVWGPLLALGTLFGLAGAIWGLPGSVQRRGAAFLFVAVGLAFFLFPAVFAAFRVRYYIPGLVTIMPGGALGISLLLERFANGTRSPNRDGGARHCEL
jgi:hypothetical protein